ncbi:MAG: hypothetical protein CL920_18165 [Deltaproteobacteria bacterium]|nr:hypothetical protein [Deltaproteobacteria bacterium]
MKRLLPGFCVLFLMFFLSSVGCSDPAGPCSQDYNCPTGQYCVRGACTSEKPETPAQEEPTVKEEPTKEPVKDASVQPEPVVEKGPIKCTSSDDCTDPSKPVCWKSKSKCVRGYITFTFTKGYTVINPTAPQAQCSSNAQCKSYQVCSSNRCFLGTGRSNNATGKIDGDGISLTDISYAYVTKNEAGASVLRTIVSTTYSEKLSKELRFDIPVAKVAKGTIQVDGTSVTATYLDQLTEFSPTKPDVIGQAIGGTLNLTSAGTAEGASIIGTAEFEF